MNAPPPVASTFPATYDDGERIAIRLSSIRPGFFSSQIAGHLDLSAARFITRTLRAHLSGDVTARITSFHDWSAMTDYDGEARVLLMDFTREMLPRVQAIHILVRSPLVAFGIRAASIIFTNVTTYTDRQRFEHAAALALDRAGKESG